MCIRKLCSCSSQKSNNNNNCRLNNEEISKKVIRNKETIYLGCPFSFTDCFIYRSGFLAVLCLYDLAFEITKLFISNTIIRSISLLHRFLLWQLISVNWIDLCLKSTFVIGKLYHLDIVTTFLVYDAAGMYSNNKII